MSDNLYFTTALAEIGVDEDEWMTTHAIPSCNSAARPALAFFQGRVYCVHRGGGGDEGLWYTSFNYAHPGANDGGWTTDTQISNQSSTAGPALAVFNDELWCVYKGGGSNQDLYFTAYDGQSWSGATTIPNQSSSDGPGLAMFNNQLWCVYVGSGSNTHLYYTFYDGDGWSNPSIIPDVAASKGPALAVFNNQLWCVYRGNGDSGNLYTTVYDGQNWNQNPDWSFPNANQTSTDAPALAYDSDLDQVVCAWVGNGSNTHLYYSNTNTASHWPSPRIIENCYSGTGPGLTEFQFVDPKNDVTYNFMICVYRNAS